MELTRRQILQGGLASGALLLGSSALAGCARDSSSLGLAGPSVSGPPRRGGVLIHGTSGGSTADSLSAWNAVNGADYARWCAQYEGLWAATSEYEVVPWLLESYTVNKTADLWTLRLRRGVHFSNGKTATMHDMLWSLQTILDPKTGSTLGVDSAGIDLKNTRVLDDRTLQVKLKRGLVNFPEIMINAPLVPIGYNSRTPVGTGPFKIKQFTPGTLTRFERNPHYWQDGKPYCDELQIVEFEDESSRINALLDGQILVADALEYTLLGLVRNQPSVSLLHQKTNSWNPLQMRCDQPPFDDVRVRQAFRLMIDRTAINAGAFAGYATLAKDLYSQNDPIYDTALPQREQDIDQAKFLLKKAGAENLAVTLTTSDVAAGIIPMSQLFAAQARQAGVNVTVNNVDAATFYGPNYGTYPLSVNISAASDYLRTVQTFDGPTSTQNLTYFKDPTFSSLYFRAVTEFDDLKRKELAWEMQKIQYDTGGLIITGFYDTFDGYQNKVQGLKPNVSGLAIFNNYANLWLAA